MDLRHLACILNYGRQAADDIQDAGLSAVLSAMTEAAVSYRLAEEADAEMGDRLPLREQTAHSNIREDWTVLSERHR